MKYDRENGKKEDKERSSSVGTGKSERKQNLKELTCNEKLKHCHYSEFMYRVIF